MRAALLPLLGLKDTYALDRLDLTVGTTIDDDVEQQVKEFLVGLKDPEQVRKIGLQQYQLLSEGDPKAMIYSFLLYERANGVNVLRVQTDDYDQPLSINQGTKLQLGSTAKLRTLINYLGNRGTVARSVSGNVARRTQCSQCYARRSHNRMGNHLSLHERRKSDWSRCSRRPWIERIREARRKAFLRPAACSRSEISIQRKTIGSQLSVKLSNSP